MLRKIKFENIIRIEACEYRFVTVNYAGPEDADRGSLWEEITVGSPTDWFLGMFDKASPVTRQHIDAVADDLFRSVDLYTDYTTKQMILDKTRTVERTKLVKIRLTFTLGSSN